MQRRFSWNVGHCDQITENLGCLHICSTFYYLRPISAVMQCKLTRRQLAVAVACKTFKNFLFFSPLSLSFFALCPRSQLTGRREGRVGRTMGVRCRDCGRESRLEPQCLERPSTPLIQLLFSCKSYQHFLLTPTITPHSWALFSLFTAHQGEG